MSAKLTSNQLRVLELYPPCCQSRKWYDAMIADGYKPDTARDLITWLRAHKNVMPWIIRSAEEWIAQQVDKGKIIGGEGGLRVRLSGESLLVKFRDHAERGIGGDSACGNVKIPNDLRSLIPRMVVAYHPEWVKVFDFSAVGSLHDLRAAVIAAARGVNERPSGVTRLELRAAIDSLDVAEAARARRQ